jgi:hypothetical protein
VGGNYASYIPAHESSVTVAPFRTWRGSQNIVAENRHSYHNVSAKTSSSSLKVCALCTISPGNATVILPKQQDNWDAAD